MDPVLFPFGASGSANGNVMWRMERATVKSLERKTGILVLMQDYYPDPERDWHLGGDSYPSQSFPVAQSWDEL